MGSRLVSLTHSYTTFEIGGLKVEHEVISSNDTIQATNERFEGSINLYDYIVSRLRTAWQVDAG